MSATPRTRRRVPPERKIRWLARPGDGAPYGLVRIVVGKLTTDYVFRDVTADFGRGCELVKIIPDDDGPAAYHILLDPAGKHTCECQGFLRWNHCKHIDGLAALLGVSGAAAA